MPSLRLVFLGSDPIALPLLQWLAGEGSAVANVVGVFTQPDRATGRGQKVQPNAIKVWAESKGLPVEQPDKLTEEVRTRLDGFRADLALVMAYGQILRDEFIGTPSLGTLNLHTSLLPKYRGASPIQTAVAAGDHETGVTLMRIVRKLDAGPVADVERVAIGALDTALEVEAKLAIACVPLLARALPKLAAGQLTFVAQDEAQATYCRKLQKDDGALDFAAPAAVVAARINGLYPWPSCAAEIGGQLIKLGLADAVPESEIADRDSRPGPGTVRGADAQGLLVQAGDTAVRLRRVQRPGGKMLAAAEFLRGFPVAPGTIIVSRPMPPLVGSAPFRNPHPPVTPPSGDGPCRA